MAKSTTDLGGVNVPLIGIEVATIGREVVAIANWSMVNIDEKR